MEFFFYTPEQRRMDNGKLVTNALQLMAGKGTAENLLKQISYSIGQSEEFVEPELRQVLLRGIRNGFLIKRGKTYSFPAPECSYQMDSDSNRMRRRRSRSPQRSTPTEIESRVKRKAARGRVGTPYKEKLTGTSAFKARLQTIRQMIKEGDERESQRARTSYRQPESVPKGTEISFKRPQKVRSPRRSPKRRKLSFMSPQKVHSPRRSPQGAHGGSPESFRSQLENLNLNDNDSDEDDL